MSTNDLDLLKELETPFEYVGESDIAREFLDAQVAVDEAKQRLAEAEAQLIVKVQNLCSKVNGNVQFRDDVRVYLYWFHPDVRPGAISEALGLSKGTRRPAVRTKLKCKWCGDPIIVTSRDSLRNEMKSYDQPLGGLHDAGYNGTDWSNCCQKKYSLWVEAQREPDRKKRNEEAQRRLVDLQTMPYRDYLQTAEWQETRKQALKRAHYKCQLCNREGRLNVHHKTYEHRGQELNSDLIVLCENCHGKFHDKLP